MKNLLLLLAYALLTLAPACRSMNKMTQLCETEHNECNQSCTPRNASFTTAMNDASMTAQQQTSNCDLRCDERLSRCLKRHEEREVKVIEE